MFKKIHFWHHFFLCILLSIYLLLYPSKLLFYPWITFQVLLIKHSTIAKSIWFHFFLGIFFSLIGSSMKLGVYSFILCLNYITLFPLRRLFIDEHLLASSLYASLFGFTFSFGEFILYQIFLSDIPFNIPPLTLGFIIKFFFDFLFSLAIFSWLYFIDFSILKLNQAYRRWRDKQEEEFKHA